MVEFAAKPIDVLTMGRIGVDIYPLQQGLTLEKVDRFGKFLGGSPTNVAVAAARLRHSVAVVTAVGDDPFGRFCCQEMGRLGVYDNFVKVIDYLSTPVTFCEIFPPDNFPIYFYRRPTAPDLQLKSEDIPLDTVRDSKIFWVTLTGMCQEPSRSAHLCALETRAKDKITILDLDYRAAFWSNKDEASKAAKNILPLVNVVVGNIEECQVTVGESDPERAAKALLDAGVELAIVKQGPKGALAMSKECKIVVPATPVKVLNGLGAGDAFGGALCHGLLERWPLANVILVASHAGALVASRLECSTAMPSEPELFNMLRVHSDIQPKETFI